MQSNSKRGKGPPPRSQKRSPKPVPRMGSKGASTGVRKQRPRKANSPPPKRLDKDPVSMDDYSVVMLRGLTPEELAEIAKG